MKPSAELGTFPAVLAHQGGWDEILMVVGPLAVVGLLLWIANKRVEAQLEAAEADPVDDPGPTPSQP
jgi:cyanate permease